MTATTRSDQQLPLVADHAGGRVGARGHPGGFGGQLDLVEPGEQLFEPQRVDGVQRGRSARGIDAGHDADQAALAAIFLVFVFVGGKG